MKQFNRGQILNVLAVFLFMGLIAPVLVLAAGPAAVKLGSAGNFVILAKTGISSTGATSIVGDLGLSPAAATYVTGFALTLPAAGAFSTSALVTGKVYASTYADPTSAKLTTAVLDMQNAYTDAAGRASTVTELGAGNIGGLTLAPGVYKWGTGLTIPTDVTLSGSVNDVWIFQIAQTLTVSSGAKVILSGGAQPGNIFWVVAGQTTIGTTAVFNGNILDQTAVVLNTGAQLNGRALAQSAVTLDSNQVTAPSGSASAPVPTPAPVVTPISASASSGSVSVPVIPTRAVNNNPLIMAPASANTFGQAVRTIAINLSKGNTNSDVTILQQFLISQNKGGKARALAQVGATGYFGFLTRAALAEFQANAGINPALGNFGPVTWAYIRAQR